MRRMLLSIIIPVFNGADYIEKAILSTEFMNNHECEIIVVDDFSCDNTVSICKKFEEFDNFKLVTLEEHSGVSVARNAGICASDSTYISFLDSDDEYLPGTIKVWLSELKSSNYDLHIYGCKVVRKNMVKLYNPVKAKSLDRPAFLKYMFRYDLKQQVRYGVLWGKIYKKEMLNKCIFQENMQLGEDTFFNIDYYGAINNAFIHNEISYKHIQTDNSLSTQRYNDYSSLLDNTLEKYKKLFSQNGYSTSSPFLIKKRIEASYRKRKNQAR